MMTLPRSKKMVLIMLRARARDVGGSIESAGRPLSQALRPTLEPSPPAFDRPGRHASLQEGAHFQSQSRASTAQQRFPAYSVLALPKCERSWEAQRARVFRA